MPISGFKNIKLYAQAWAKVLFVADEAWFTKRYNAILEWNRTIWKRELLFMTDLEPYYVTYLSARNLSYQLSYNIANLVL